MRLTVVSNLVLLNYYYECFNILIGSAVFPSKRNGKTTPSRLMNVLLRHSTKDIIRTQSFSFPCVYRLKLFTQYTL